MFRVHNPGYQKQKTKKTWKKTKTWQNKTEKLCCQRCRLTANSSSRAEKQAATPTQPPSPGPRARQPVHCAHAAYVGGWDGNYSFQSASTIELKVKATCQLSFSKISAETGELKKLLLQFFFFSALYVYLFMQTAYQHFYQYNDTIQSNATSLIGPIPTFLQSCATTISLSSGMQLFNSKDHLFVDSPCFYLIQSSLGASQGATSMTLSFVLSSEPRMLGSDHGALIHQGFWSQWSRYDPRGASLPYNAKRNQLQRRVDGV